MIKLKVLTWCLKQNRKVYTLVDQNFSSWDKIFVFSDWSILFLNCGFELDLDEQRPFVDRNYYKNSFLQNRSLSVGKLKWRITKMFLNFYKGGDHFWRIYTHIEYIRRKNSLGPTIHSPVTFNGKVFGKFCKRLKTIRFFEKESFLSETQSTHSNNFSMIFINNNFWKPT